MISSYYIVGWYWFLVATITSIPKGHKSSPRRTITPSVSAFARDLLRLSGTPGLSLGIVYLDGPNKLEEEYGTWGMMTEDGDKVTQEIVFNVGSCSKAFVSAAMGILIDDFEHGRNKTPLPPDIKSLSWKTKIHHLLPEWELMDPVASRMANIQDILSHVSGLSRHDFMLSDQDTSLSVLPRMRHLKPAYEFREKNSYNNMMYLVGARIVTKYADMDFIEFVRQRIFEPLNMSTSTYFAEPAKRSGLLSHAFGEQSRRIPFWFEGQEELFAGPGGVLSSAVDMNKWLAMLLNGGINPRTNKTVIPKAALDAATVAHSVMFNRAPLPELSIVGYGMGWTRQSYRGHEVIAHAGNMHGYSAYMAFFPWDGFGLVALSNMDGNDDNGRRLAPSDVPFAIMTRATDSVLGLRSSSSTDSHIDLVSRDLTRMDPFLVQPVTQNLSATPPLPIHMYEGTYTHPAYGSFTLCSSSSTTPQCQSVLATFSSVYPNLSASDLVASWPRFWTKQLHLQPGSGNEFSVRVTRIFPKGYGSNTRPFEQRQPYEAFSGEFVLEAGHVKGLAMPQGFQALPDLDFDSNGNIADNAQVYFRRIQAEQL
ncbi:beta-lactamase/transpeptidase-like protein [Trametopsis cervina]|nr:beta-lactamase/transpeptidase-like protein [Trametopsis cervina]